MDNKTVRGIALNFLITFLVIAAILYFLDFSRLVALFLQAKVEFVLLAFVVYLAVNALMAVRIWELMRGLEVRIPFLEVLRTQFGGMLASDITPARSGYFFTAFSLSAKHKVPLEKSMTVIFGPQLLEFFLKILAGAAVMWMVLERVDVLGGNAAFAGLFVLAVLAAIGFFGALMFSRGFLEKFSFAKRFSFGRKGFYFFLLMQKHSHILFEKIWFLLGIEAAGWLTKSLEWSLYFWALGLHLSGNFVSDYAFFILFHAFITFLHFIPLPTLAGAGTAEAASAAVLVAFGVPFEAGVAFTFLTRGGMFLVDLLGLPAILEFAREKDLSELFEFEQRLEGRERELET